MEDTAGRGIRYYYDAEGRLDMVQDADAKTTSYDYDTIGRLDRIDVPSLTTWSYVNIEYDASHRVTKITREPSISTTFAYSSGQTVVTDPNGHAATYKIDSDGRVFEAKDALNRTRSRTWTANSDIATTTDGMTSGNQSTYTYDGNANQTRAQLPTGAAASAAYAIGAGCTAPDTGTAFQPKCSTDAAGNSKQYEYDASGNLTRQVSTTGGTNTTDFESTYDNSSRGVCGGYAGQVCSTKDGNGKTTTYLYNVNGDLTKVTPPPPLGATSFVYDSMGRLTSTTDGNKNTVGYIYDARNRILEADYPNTATIKQAYYPNGLLKYRQDGGATNAVNFEYDPLGRLTEQRYVTTSSALSVKQQYTYDDVGNILTYNDGTATSPAKVTYTYDAANQLTSIREPGGTCPVSGNPTANSGCTLLQYDNNANEVKRIYPGGATTDTARDNSGRPTRITAKATGGITAVDIAYSYMFPGTSIDQDTVQVRTSHKEEGVTSGAVTTYTYDVRSRLAAAEEKVGTTVAASWSYSYDGADNRIQQVRSGATGAAAGTINYTYNNVNQITSATGESTTWTYDGAGNQTRKGLGGQLAAYNDRLQATAIGGTAQGYLAAGNTDRLISGATTFQSGALGLMKSRTGAATMTFTRGPDGTAIGYRAAAANYFATDHLGSVVGVFTASGTYAGGYSYSPYGETRAIGTNAAVTANPLRYIGGHADASGLYKLGARYYDAALGRFTQPDPSGQEDNPYLYATANPVNSSDPSGLVAPVVIAGIAAIGRIVITGISRHAITRIAVRGGSPTAIRGALRNPSRAFTDLTNSRGPVSIYQGASARVVINQQGRIVSVIPRPSKGPYS